MLWLGEEYFSGDGIAVFVVGSHPVPVRSYQIVNHSIPRVHAALFVIASLPQTPASLSMAGSWSAMVYD